MQSRMSRWRTRTAGRKPSPRSASVVGHAQIVEPLSRSRSSSAPFACVACTTVVRSPRQPQSASSSIGRRAVLGEALVDLPRLLARMHVQHELLRVRVAAQLLEPVARARADGVGGDPDGDPALTQSLDLAQVPGHGALTHPFQAAPRVRHVEADEGQPGGGGGLGRRERRLDPEVVELADRSEPRGAHLAVGALVEGPDRLGRVSVRLREHPLAPGPEVASRGPSPERALEGVAVGVHETGKRDHSCHGRRH